MSAFQSETIGWMQSLPTSDLTRVLSNLSPERQAAAIVALKEAPQPGTKTERDKDIVRKRQERSEASRIEIPQCKDPRRREACLADPERFLREYLPKKFKTQFGRLHCRLIDAIHDRALAGGKKAIAAPRSKGKSTIVKGMNLYLVAAELVRFLVPVCATRSLAGRIYADFRREWATNETLLEDFPEICWPARALEGAPQRAAKQHVDGHLTHINWSTTDFLRLPRVPGNANDYLKSQCKQWSPYGGVKMTFLGFDTAFRGLNIDDDRPDYLILDDPESRESAKHQGQIDDRIEIIERDIEGLEGDDKPMAMTMITTVQNTFCLSAQFTDPERRPAWEGERYGLIEKWPDRLDMWDDYIALRKAGQVKGDRHGMDAVEFYLANREAMDAGVIMLAENFKEIKLKDGTLVVHSALQEAYNKIADTNLSAFNSEYQNDPDPEDESEKTELTSAIVVSRLSGLEHGEVPEEAPFTFVGMDIGKYKSHWVKIAVNREAVMWITDYGAAETHGLSKYSQDQTVESALLEMLKEFDDSPVCTERPPLLTLIDSGYFPQPVYDFSLAYGKNKVFPSKGIDPGKFTQKKASDEYVPFLEAYAHNITDDKKRSIWLYVINGEYWKNWGQERFLVAPFIDNTRIPGSVALFDPPHGDKKFHLHLGRHMVSESREMVPVDKKHNKPVWIVHDKNNNHWLDAYALACAAAGCAGIRILESPAKPISQQIKQPRRPAIVNPYGQPFLATERR